MMMIKYKRIVSAIDQRKDVMDFEIGILKTYDGITSSTQDIATTSGLRKGTGN